jgi:hypothetical protein
MLWHHSTYKHCRHHILQGLTVVSVPLLRKQNNVVPLIAIILTQAIVILNLILSATASSATASSTTTTIAVPSP